MKKIVYSLLAIMLFSLTACEVDEKKADFVNTGIGYDDTYGAPGTYYYSAQDNTVQVLFYVNGTDAKTATVALINADGKVAKTDNITVGDKGSCVVTYDVSLLGISIPDIDVDENWPLSDGVAKIQITAGGFYKEIPIQLLSPWYSVSTLRLAGTLKSTVVPSVIPAIAAKTINDTITFGASVDSWVNMSGATWGLQYKVGSGSWVDVASPVVSASKTSIKYITKFSDMGVPITGSKVYYRATVTSNGVTNVYPGQYFARTILPITAGLTSTSSVNTNYFNPAITSASNDTITFKNFVPSVLNRTWLKLSGATWTLAYKTSNSPTASTYTIDPAKIKVKMQNDTISVINYIDVIGQLQNLQQYDTLTVIAKMSVLGASASQSFKYVVPKFKK